VASSQTTGEEVYSIGATLRTLRKAAGLTLVQLAEEAQLSQPFLSQLENDQAMPSLTALHRIARALGTTTQALLASAMGKPSSVIRASEAPAYVHSPDVAVRFLVSDSQRMLAVNEVRAGANTEGIHDLQHAGDEVVHVIEGEVEITVEGEDPVILGAGDTYAFNASIPHSWRVVGAGSARFLMIGTPPSF
jgi:transcriptional regulator with XRE-family HTH domain